MRFRKYGEGSQEDAAGVRTPGRPGSGAASRGKTRARQAAGVLRVRPGNATGAGTASDQPGRITATRTPSSGDEVMTRLPPWVSAMSLAE